MKLSYPSINVKTNGNVFISFVIGDKRIRLSSGKKIGVDINPNSYPPNERYNIAKILCSEVYNYLMNGGTLNGDLPKNLPEIDYLEEALKSKLKENVSKDYKRTLSYVFREVETQYKTSKSLSKSIKLFLEKFAHNTSYNTIKKHLSVLVNKAMEIGLGNNPMKDVKSKKSKQILHKPFKNIRGILNEIESFAVIGLSVFFYISGMKTTLLFLSVFLSANLFGQEDRGYLIIENKGKSKCFFDKSNPHNLVNMMSQNYADGGFSEFYIQGYDYKKYAELDKYVFPGSPLTTEVDGYEEILINDPEKNQTFDIWFDSIVNLSFDPTESYLLMYDKEWLHKKWLQSIINGGSGYLRDDPPQTYASFDGIDKLIITYEKRSDEFRYDDVYFIREVASVSKPIIVGKMPFPEYLKSQHGFELTDDETEALWSMNRKKAFENKLRNVAEFLFNGQAEYSKIESLGPPDYQAGFNFGRKYVAEQQGAPIEVNIDLEGSVLMFKEGQTYNEWYDSIVNLSFDPTDSELLLFGDGYLELQWENARFAEDKIIRQPDYEIVYWWDYEGYSAHLLYEINVDLNNYKFKPYINYGGGSLFSPNDSTYNAFFAIKSGDIIIPLTRAELENGTTDSFEQFKKENTEFSWAKLLYNQKAGKYISDDEKGRSIIDEMIETQVGFITKNKRLDAVFSIDYE